jgi:hypothetical protein
MGMELKKNHYIPNLENCANIHSGGNVYNSGGNRPTGLGYKRRRGY